MTCENVADLLDLYAADECPPPERKSVRAHLDRCPACRESLAHSRATLALLDVHFRQDQALARLGERLHAEARPARRQTLPFLRPFLAVAALVLITFGLGLWLTPATHSAPIHLQLALASPFDDAELGPPPVRGLKKALIEADTAKLATLQLARDTGDWPLPPPVDVELVISNPGREPIRLDLGGPGFRCDLDLSAPTERRLIDRPEFVPFPARTVTVPPGASLTLDVERLASQVGGRVTYIYPTKPGDAELRVRLEVPARRGNVRSMMRLDAGPRPLRLR